MRERTSDGKFWRIYNEPLDKWIRLQHNTLQLDRLIHEAAKRGTDPSGLIRAAIDADPGTWITYAGQDGRQQLAHRMAAVLQKFDHDGVYTIYWQCRVTAEQKQRLRDRCAAMGGVSIGYYVNTAVAAYLGWI